MINYLIRNKKTLEKIQIIEKYIKELNLDFDNTKSNQYELIYNNNRYAFNTYDGVINALKLIKEMEVK